MYGKRHVLTFALTFLSYAGLHTLRSGWAFSKDQIQDEFQIENIWFAYVDTLYLAFYSFGMIVTNHFTRYIQLKTYISIGMMTSAFCFMCVAFSYQIGGEFIQVAVIIFMCLNGFCQSTGWPGVIGIMGNWFQKQKTGVILGIWAINANVGNIIAQVICNLMENNLKLKWTYNFIVTGLFTITIAVLVLIFLKDKPDPIPQLQVPINKDNERAVPQQIIKNLNEPVNDPQLPPTSQNMHQESIITTQEQADQYKRVGPPPDPPKMNIFRTFCLPGVPLYVIGYSMLKGCIYGLLLWLPKYLHDQNLDQQKGYIGSMVDVGSLIGGLLIGYLSDRYKYKAIYLSPLLFVSSLTMFSTAYFLTDVAWQYFITMFVIGITIGGPYNIIGGVITIDLGKKTKALGGNTETVSAVIQGSAAIFAAGSQIPIGALDKSLVFYVFFFECIIASIVLFPLFWSDFKQFRKQRESKESNQLNQEA